MLHTEKEGTPEFDEIKKLKNRMAEMFNKLEDFKVLAATLQTEAPVRDAYKAVFNIDKPELDPNTPEGMRKKNEMNAYMGKTND
jgi:hypothetical protein